MDISQIIASNTDFIVSSTFDNVDQDETMFIDTICDIFSNHFDISFDMEHFYLFKRNLSCDNIYFQVASFKTPEDIKRMVLLLIKSNEMKQRVKSRSYSIIFREFRNCYLLEASARDIREQLILSALKIISDPFKLISRMIRMKIDYLNVVRKNKGGRDFKTMESIYKLDRCIMFATKHIVLENNNHLGRGEDSNIESRR